MRRPVEILVYMSLQRYAYKYYFYCCFRGTQAAFVSEALVFTSMDDKGYRIDCVHMYAVKLS